MTKVLIHGQGVAACACAKLLSAPDYAVSLQPSARPKIPAILLGGVAQTLLRDVFGDVDWLRELPRIDKRIVAWGPGQKPVVVPHLAVIVSEAALTDHLRPDLAPPFEGPPDWTFFASRPLPPAVTERHIGTRRATAVHVNLRPGADASACWIESLAEGWLFLIPVGAGAGWLIGVGSSPSALLTESCLIAPQIDPPVDVGAEFPAYPRIADPLCGPGWLLGGTAAIGFDPICGDGTGHALREAILAAAVIRAAARSAHVPDLLAHYQARLTAGFNRHLAACRPFYATGGTTPWWRTELRFLEEAILRNEPEPEYRFRLDGFDLIHFSPGLR